MSEDFYANHLDRLKNMSDQEAADILKTIHFLIYRDTVTKLTIP